VNAAIAGVYSQTTKALYICYFISICSSDQILLFVELQSKVFPVWLEVISQKMAFEN
jgi:hypothetical protein